MFRRSALVLGALALMSLLFSGCHRKPKTVPQAAPPVEAPAPKPPRAPEPPPPPPSAPEPTAEAPFDPYAGDLKDLTAYAVSQGLLGDVFFDFDRAELSESARDRLVTNARFLNDHPELLVRIEGHCDERGTNEYNLALSERRANAVREYLGSLRVEPGRSQTLSLGEEKPFCTESHEGCWRENRRAHFVLSGRRE